MAEREPLKNQERVVAVIGLGYVGLPLALAFARAGFRVVGFDTDPAKVEQLNAGTSYSKAIPAEDLSGLVRAGQFRASGEFARLREAQAILVSVPTPLSEQREPDLQFLRATAATIAQQLQRGQLVVVESTSYPGTTEEVVLPLLEASGLRCPPQADSPGCETSSNPLSGATPDFYLAFSPERIDPGNTRYRLTEIPKLIGGVNPASAERARALYAQVFARVVVVSSAQVAEMAKLLENIYRAVNIALVNELKLLCQRMGVDAWEVIEAAATKPFGFMPFAPGPGLGGHCIPVDPFYLAWKARQYDFPTRFIELAGEINTAMPHHVVAAVAEALNQRQQALRGARVLLLGVAYKKDVDDLRESPALKIMELLEARGATVAYNDPHVPALPVTRRYDFSRLRSVPLERLADYDCVVIVTDHSAYDWGAIVAQAQLVVDTRNATRAVRFGRSNVVLC
ncbi:MAG: nucleotide sugar dehydrogenase [Terriglobia bacterium]